MISSRLVVVATLAGALALAGCSGSTSSTSSTPASGVASAPAASASATPEEVDLGALAASQAGEASPGASGSVDPLTQWCNSYAFLSKTIAEAGTNPESTDTALRAVERFRELWVLAGNAELVTQAEAEANLRAVAAYNDVIKVIAAGGTETSPEFVAARKNVTTTTNADHKLLQSSAGKIIGYCGAASASPSPSAS